MVTIDLLIRNKFSKFCIFKRKSKQLRQFNVTLLYIVLWLRQAVRLYFELCPLIFFLTDDVKVSKQKNPIQSR